MMRKVLPVLIIFACFFYTGCNKAPKEITTGKWTILDTKTDNGNQDKAKKNAEMTIKKHPDITAMVGLWGYNAPNCYEALKDADLLGKVQIISFDGFDRTLKGIKEGHIHSTVVQQPFEFGYQSIKMMVEYNKGKKPQKVINYIPIKKLYKDKSEDGVSLEEHINKVKKLRSYDVKNEIDPKNDVYYFITNGPNPFWDLARAGCRKAAKDFGVTVEFKSPESLQKQNQLLEQGMNIVNLKGVAISPVDPANQTEILNKIAEKCVLICQDSDAPKSNRVAYIGTDNYEAGRIVGANIKKCIPNGGTLMLYVGKMEVLNAQERRQGIIDELSGKPKNQK